MSSQTLSIEADSKQRKPYESETMYLHYQYHNQLPFLMKINGMTFLKIIESFSMINEHDAGWVHFYNNF